jgi:hypothetical protein
MELISEIGEISATERQRWKGHRRMPGTRAVRA